MDNREVAGDNAESHMTTTPCRENEAEVSGPVDAATRSADVAGEQEGEHTQTTKPQPAPKGILDQ